MELQECALETDCVGNFRFHRVARQSDSREWTRARRRIVHQRLDLSMPGNQSEDLIPRALHEPSTEHNVVPDVVHSTHEVFQLDERLIGRELRLLRVFRERSAAL